MQQIFPVILKPSFPDVRVLPMGSKQTKVRKRGASELVDRARIFRLRLKDVREDVCVNIEGHAYEPDFAYINKEKGIYVDIEVDEPYTGGGRPTHYLLPDGSNSDAVRNARFLNAGWYVCRFSEQQFYCHTKSCMKEVYSLLLSEGLIDVIPKKLASAPDLKEDSRWTETEARSMYRKKYRVSYLGYNPLSMAVKDNLYCIVLVIPMFFESIWNWRLGKELYRQLWNWFFH